MRQWDGWDRVRAGDRDAMLVVDSSPETRLQLASDMRALGFEVVEAGAPLEAIDVLDHAADDICAVIVAPTLVSTSQAALAQFIAEQYPDIPQVLVRGHHWHEGRADHRWLLFDLAGELVNEPRGGRMPSARRRLARGSQFFTVRVPRE